MLSIDGCTLDGGDMPQCSVLGLVPFICLFTHSLHLLIHTHTHKLLLHGDDIYKRPYVGSRGFVGTPKCTM